MYRAMIEKDAGTLALLLDESFHLVHMTGMRQNKESFIKYLQDGVLNYFSEELCDSTVIMQGETAKFVGKSLVNAAVFGGGRHTWRLQLDMRFVLIDGEWLIAEAIASSW